MKLEAAPAWALVTLAVLAGLLCQLLLGTSYVAASLDPLREEDGVPVAVLVQDQGPHGGALLARLQETRSPVLWVALGDRDAMLDGLAQKSYFGALVIPTNFSAALDSFASDAPRAAQVEVYANPGASTSGSLVAARAIELALEATRDVVRERAIGAAEVGTTGLGALSLDQARFVAEPIHVEARTVNAVPLRGANGLAPTYLAMAAWIGGYLGSVALERFRPQTRLRAGGRALVIVGASLAQGAIATLAAAAIGLAMRDALAIAAILAVGTWMAYSLVSLLMDVFGLAGILPAFAILAVGLPASGAIYPAGLLPDLYASLHAADPFTWLVEALRSALYAPGASDVDGHVGALAGLALACTLLSVLISWLGARRDARGAREA